MEPNTLVPSISIANPANQRVAVVERVRAALDLLGEAQQLAKAAHLGFPRLVLDESYGCRGRPTITGEYAKRDEAEAAMVRLVDVRGWDYLLSESGLRTFMDAKARDQWSHQIAEGEVPELTVANIEATFAQLYGARGDMFERGVLQCFQRLSWDYKTNQPFKFGKRIIVRYLLARQLQLPRDKRTGRSDASVQRARWQAGAGSSAWHVDAHFRGAASTEGRGRARLFPPALVQERQRPPDVQTR
jgi:hypothetical protein